MKVYIEYDMSQVKHLTDGMMPTRLRTSMSAALRRGLALVEAHHKMKEFRRGAGAGPSDPGRVSSRTGTLSRSYRIYHEKSSLVGYYGSELRRARILEVGGEIKPKGHPFLAIPTGPARHGVGGGIGPRHHSDLTFIPLHGGTSGMLAKVVGDDLIPYFWLVHQVRIGPRRMLDWTRKATESQIEKLIADAAEGSVRDGK